jgi:hypothetical protein
MDWSLVNFFFKLAYYIQHETDHEWLLVNSQYCLSTIIILLWKASPLFITLQIIPTKYKLVSTLANMTNDAVNIWTEDFVWMYVCIFHESTFRSKLLSYWETPSWNCYGKSDFFSPGLPHFISLLVKETPISISLLSGMGFFRSVNHLDGP